MAITARTWVEGELATAAKLNTIRDDLLELDAVAGFNNAQYGTVSFSGTSFTADATVSPMSARAIIHNLGFFTSTGVIEGVYLTKLNSTTVRATRGTNGSIGSPTAIVGFAIEDPRG